MSSLTVLILTHNEARHIERCIASLGDVAARIVVVDSGSTDATRDLAAAMGAEVFTNPWINYATQFNWAIDKAADTAAASTDWIMRLDADEVVLPALRDELARLDTQTASGLTIRRQIHFLGRWLRWGAVYPVQTLRLWRTGRGRCEDRWMDEHILVDGEVRHINADIADINLNNIGWWTDKHNRYATRMAIDALLLESRPDSADGGAIGWQPRLKRWIVRNVYSVLPLGLRSLGYFLYRYVLRLGFLDGWPGLVFHSLQAGWYRFLIDVKISEIRALMAARGDSLATVVEAEYGHRI